MKLVASEKSSAMILAEYISVELENCPCNKFQHIVSSEQKEK